ncbi:hypothetical protein BHX98_19665 [Acinetobacter baumannii]|nr:hypothetical protein BHX98_19665 [Acinetobacter baumannii]
MAERIGPSSRLETVRIYRGPVDRASVLGELLVRISPLCTRPEKCIAGLAHLHGGSSMRQFCARAEPCGDGSEIWFACLPFLELDPRFPRPVRLGAPQMRGFFAQVTGS